MGLARIDMIGWLFSTDVKDGQKGATKLSFCGD
jgi:hypothetical protein